MNPETDVFESFGALVRAGNPEAVRVQIEAFKTETPFKRSQLLRTGYLAACQQDDRAMADLIIQSGLVVSQDMLNDAACTGATQTAMALVASGKVSPKADRSQAFRTALMRQRWDTARHLLPLSKPADRDAVGLLPLAEHDGPMDLVEAILADQPSEKGIRLFIETCLTHGRNSMLVKALEARRVVGNQNYPTFWLAQAAMGMNVEAAALLLSKTSPTDAIRMGGMSDANWSVVDQALATVPEMLRQPWLAVFKEDQFPLSYRVSAAVQRCDRAGVATPDGGHKESRSRPRA